MTIRKRSVQSSGNRLPVCKLYFALLVAVFIRADAASLNVGELEATGTNSGTVPIEFRSAGDVAAVQLDILFDAAAYTANSAIQGTLGDTFRVDSRLVEAGRLRVVVGAPNNAALPDSVVFRVPLTTASSFSSFFPVTLANMRLSSALSASIAGYVAPSVRFSNVTSGGSVNGKNGVTLAANALVSDGSISRVEFYEGSNLIGSSSISPFSLTWNPSAAGSYNLRAVAFDNNGQQTSAKIVPVSVFFNSPPRAGAVTLTMTQNRTSAIPFTTLLGQTSDPDGDSLIISELDDRTANSGILNPVGNIIEYTPQKNFVGTDSFTYGISDGLDGTADGSVNLLVTRALQTDLDSDQKADLVLVSSNGLKTQIFALNSGPLKRKFTGPSIPSGYQLVAVDDFNRDGANDFLVYNTKTRKTQMRLLKGIVSKGNKTGPTITSGYQIVAVDDFDSDGKTDLLLFHPKTRKTIVWYLNDYAKRSSGYGPTLSTGWTIAGTDDFNNDGKPDLCLMNSKRTQVTVWYLNNRSLLKKSSKLNISSGYQMAGLADIDHNGKPDLVIYNPKNSKTSIWKLNNFSVANKSNGPTLSSGYTIAAPK